MAALHWMFSFVSANRLIANANRHKLPLTSHPAHSFVKKEKKSRLSTLWSIQNGISVRVFSSAERKIDPFGKLNHIFHNTWQGSRIPTRFRSVFWWNPMCDDVAMHRLEFHAENNNKTKSVLIINLMYRKMEWYQSVITIITGLFERRYTLTLTLTRSAKIQWMLAGYCTVRMHASCLLKLDQVIDAVFVVSCIQQSDSESREREREKMTPLKAWSFIKILK